MLSFFLCHFATKLGYSVKAANDASGIKQSKANTDLSMFFHYWERSSCTVDENCRWARPLWHCAQTARSPAGCTTASICIPYLQHSSFLSGQHNLHKEEKCIKTIPGSLNTVATPICKILPCSETLREKSPLTVEVTESHVTKCVRAHVRTTKGSGGSAKISK